MVVQVKTLTGQDLIDALPSLAQLRIEVFREYPYLYDGSLAYEEGYLKSFANSRDSIIVTAEDNHQMIGCSTGSALTDHHDEFAFAFDQTDFDVDTVFYCSESILKSSYRGLGLGHVFFDRRETHARDLNYRHSCFSSVLRPDDHPLKPENYRPLDQFWIKKGYTKLNEVTSTFRWKDIDQPIETEHVMQFWIKALST